MNQEQTQTIHACAAGSLSGSLTFPQIVERPTAIGIERYHADDSRQEITYYLPDGDSLVVPSPHPHHPTAAEFTASAVEAAVRQSQRNEHTYPTSFGKRWPQAVSDTSSRSRPAGDLFWPQRGKSRRAVPGLIAAGSTPQKRKGVANLGRTIRSSQVSHAPPR
jgi:hypothetical protein